MLGANFWGILWFLLNFGSFLIPFLVLSLFLHKACIIFVFSAPSPNPHSSLRIDLFLPAIIPYKNYVTTYNITDIPAFVRAMWDSQCWVWFGVLGGFFLVINFDHQAGRCLKNTCFLHKHVNSKLSFEFQSSLNTEFSVLLFDNQEG